MKNVLIVLSHNSRRSFGFYPSTLQRAGYAVTVMGNAKFKPFVGCGYTKWISGSADLNHLILEVADEFTNGRTRYDWVMLGDDDLLSALKESKIPEHIKTRIGPVGQAHYIPIFANKHATSSALNEIGLRVSPFKKCHTFDDIHAAIGEFGIPVIIKPNQGLGSDGIHICKTQDDIAAFIRQFKPGDYVLEKYIAGDRIRLDPLFINGKLVAANASFMHHTVRGELGVSTERKVTAAAPFYDLLVTMGEKLQLSGFMNIGGMRETTTGDFYLFELDCRPNEWPCYKEVFGVDMAKALIDFHSNPDFTARAYLSPDNQQIAKSFIRDIPYQMRKRNIKGILGWLTNKDGCWRCLPFHDLRLFAYWIWVVICECVTSIIEKIAKTFGFKRPARS